MHCIWSGSRAMRQLGDRRRVVVCYGRHPATVEFGSIPQNRNVRPIISAKNSLGIDKMEMESSSGLPSSSHARLVSWND